MIIREIEDASTLPDVEHTSAETEHTQHNYVGNVIPWFVRFIWIGFWAYAVYYAIVYIFPAIQTEIFRVKP
ncbi:MAG: hypothetical protein R3E01_14540 [Pirellulaceae bacterium]|nr:hypothetical protein [Planctomycetales bacterium]